MLTHLSFVRCDGCGTSGPTEVTAKRARAAARRRGFKRVPGSAKVGKDYCAGCAWTRLDVK